MDPDENGHREQLAEKERRNTRAAFSEKVREIERVYSMELARVDRHRQLANDYRKIAFDINQVTLAVESGVSPADLRGNNFIASMPAKFIQSEFGLSWVPSETVWNAAFLGSLDTKDRKGYWADPKEMFARSFETFIRRKMDGDGRGNNMLVQESYPQSSFSPYPDPAECEGIDGAMEEFIRVLKAKRYF